MQVFGLLTRRPIWRQTFTKEFALTFDKAKLGNETTGGAGVLMPYIRTHSQALKHTVQNARSVQRDYKWPLLVQEKGYATLGSGWSFRRVQHTKYRITKPWTTDTMFDDLILSQPCREDFAKFSKEAPLFLRFLKLVTDVEGRQTSFIEFAKRCEHGLVVEKDVYITKKELIDCLWKNGYSKTEINAFEIAFPADYQFHYPELAVLFDLTEEDCYKYCIRQRAAKPENLVELKYKKPTNLLSSYGLCFLGVWFGLSNTVLSNAWFYSKTFPFGAVFYMLASYYYREIREYFWKEERSLIVTAKGNKDSGEEAVYNQMKKYSTDTKCLEYLRAFKDDVETQMTQYRYALLHQIKRQTTDRVLAKLNAIEQAERSNQSSLQEVMVHEIVMSFKDSYNRKPHLQEAALKSAIQGLGGNDGELDPVAAQLKTALQELGKVDLFNTKGDASGTVVERVAAVFQKREKDFLNSFTVGAEEAREVQRIVATCKRGMKFDFTLLSKEDAQKLESLYKSINEKVGFEVVHEDALKSVTPFSGKSKEFVEAVNRHLERTRAQIRHGRLTAFAEAFA